ncbi:hypothetical protein RRG08_033095 [Elysia crispata]|uniref:Uncharacterized protein n=1 Tax=Elysia crispata TaxID=231223 RepID=A0AAE1ECG7_9GAST|nr:hypothetical protein RRG08_033095 [Elysia crispata]
MEESRSPAGKHRPQIGTVRKLVLAQPSWTRYWPRSSQVFPKYFQNAIKVLDFRIFLLLCKRSRATAGNTLSPAH